ncbi:hypothetical protein PVAND_006731 [Polypedilum vanderplanki]|uniref:Muskelin N-terminal domain-containing protein n=1 Tax=Polypedilum vanderplanki TaxID=319348 RepID=A0A9J6C5R7_POLVA|nr:hypothetical protein PVAND_006731 [Polypedilum vanderplanki]
MEIERITKLPYEIHSFSSFSSSYLPENIRDNCPTNQISRWSSDTNGLKNDNVPETFDLKHKMYIEDEGVERDIPILYVQIVPLLSFGPSFNFSIWYVELQGIDSEVYVIDMMKNFNDQREKLAIRLILKHLRDKGFMRAFKALEIEAKISLEDNQITELFHSLVEMGDFIKLKKLWKILLKTENILMNTFQAKNTQPNIMKLKRITKKTIKTMQSN